MIGNYIIFDLHFNSMKVITTFLLLISLSFYGQEKIEFEQEAFEFYRDSILKINPPKGKISLNLDLERENFLFFYPRCLKIDDAEFVWNLSGNKRIRFAKDGRFKIRKTGKGNYPHVYLTVSFSNTFGQNIVTVVENYKSSGTTYFIQMNNEGKVVDWCKDGWVE